MVIDVHGHLACRTEHPLDAAEAEAYARSSGVDLIVVSNWAAASNDAGGIDLDEANANAACLVTCVTCHVLVPLYWARPGRFDSNVDAFAGALSSEPFVGAIFSPLLNGFDVADHALLAPYLTTLAGLGLPAVFRIGPDPRASLVNTLALARCHPRVPFVLLDAARDRLWSDAVEDVRRELRRGELQAHLDTAGVRAEDLRAGVEILGPQPLLFGSGGTVLNDAQARSCRMVLDDLRRQLSPPDFERITGTNAHQLFHTAAARPG